MMREDLIFALTMIGFAAMLALAVVVSEMIKVLPWLVLAGSVGVCLIVYTFTRCLIMYRRAIPPPWRRWFQIKNVYLNQIDGAAMPQLEDQEEKRKWLKRN